MTVLDSHAVLRLAEKPELLSEAAKNVLAVGRERGDLAAAAVTLLEIAWMLAKKRATVATPPMEYLRFLEARFRVISLDAQIARRATEFGADYPRDSADRTIVQRRQFMGLCW